MFNQQTYIGHRAQLKEEVGQGIIILFGNNGSPANGPFNGYHPFRQGSSSLYYFGQNRDGLVDVIDIDSDTEALIGDDIDIEDIVWFGSIGSVKGMAEQVGVSNSAPMKHLKTLCNATIGGKRKVHLLSPYHHGVRLQMYDLLDTHPSQQKESASLDLIKTVVKVRFVKEPQGIEELERATKISCLMHATAVRLTKPCVIKKFIDDQVDDTADSHGAVVSFPITFSQHGKVMHGGPSLTKFEAGRLALCDAGAETVNNYCLDNARTFPVDGKYAQQQLETYSIVEVCHNRVFEVTKPGVKCIDMHFSVRKLVTERLKELGLTKGDTEETVRAGAHAMFLPHGLGHVMGMDVHDTEALGQIYVGFDDETRPDLEQFGTNALRMGRRLEGSFVVTGEPGIHFIPALIDEWKASGHCTEFLNFDELRTYKNFGGIRIENDILVTKDGYRFLGKDRIPYHPKNVEALTANSLTKQFIKTIQKHEENFNARPLSHYDNGRTGS